MVEIINHDLNCNKYQGLSDSDSLICGCMLDGYLDIHVNMCG